MYVVLRMSDVYGYVFCSAHVMIRIDLAMLLAVALFYRAIDATLATRIETSHGRCNARKPGGVQPGH